MRVTPIRPSAGGGARQNFADERDRLIYIIDDLILSSKDVPNGLRLTTSFGHVNKEKCQTLVDFLESSTDDRLIRIRNLAMRLLKFLDR